MFKGKEQEEASSFVSVNTLVGPVISQKNFTISSDKVMVIGHLPVIL